MIVAKEWCRQEYAYYFSVNEQRLFYSFSTNGNCNVTSQIGTTDQLITPGEFHHVAVVHSPTEVKLYVDGIERSSAYVSGGFGRPINSNEPLRIGAYQAVDRSFFAYYSGLIDELRVWSSALPAGEITARMNGQLTGNEDDLALYLDMEESESAGDLTLQNKANINNPSSAVPLGIGNGTPYTISPAGYASSTISISAEELTCTRSSATLSLPEADYKSILWSTGETNNSTQIAALGTYSVLVETEACRFLTDSVELTTVASNNSLAIQGLMDICPGGPLGFTAILDNPDEVGTYTWELPDSGAAAGAELRLNEALAGQYIVTFIDDNNCDTLTATATIIACEGDYDIPELVTPNGDGVNDEFRLYYKGSVQNYELLVFNRWGQKIFSANDPNNAWDGTIRNEPQESGSYLYVMRFSLDGTVREESGSFSLIR
jgi:gliding motility-associated-like protein